MEAWSRAACTSLGIEFHRPPISRRLSGNYFFAKSGDLDQVIRLPLDDRRFVEGCERKGVRILSRLGAELYGRGPFAMQVNSTPPSRYLRALAGRFLYVRAHTNSSGIVRVACTDMFIAPVVDDAHADTGKTYLPCTIARLHISRDAQHVITRAESKKTIASRPANRRSRANESEPTRPMAGPRASLVNPV